MLSIKNLGKTFRSYDSEWRRFARWFGVPVTPSEEHWVVRHINFDIQSGESIGIIGQNGAGKSTLLKMITGTLEPAEGMIQVNGRIAAILELGMGFNPDLTGRQNAYHGLGLMGFTYSDIELVMPELEVFAEIGEYFDEPVRTYSSGMQMRVAFAVVTAFRPEILIVDEALSVGDAYFQHKSFARIREFQKKSTTLLIVSHDRSAIQILCNRAILLEKGMVRKDGKPEEVFDFYNAIIAEKEGGNTVKVTKTSDGRAKTHSGTGEAKVEEIILYNSKGKKVDTVGVGEQIELHIKIKIYQAIETLALGFLIKDRLGQIVYGTSTWNTDQVLGNLQPGEDKYFVIRFPTNFGVGNYSISTAIAAGKNHVDGNMDWQDFALIFNVINMDKKDFIGSTWVDPKITIKGLCK